MLRVVDSRVRLLLFAAVGGEVAVRFSAALVAGEAGAEGAPRRPARRDGTAGGADGPDGAGLARLLVRPCEAGSISASKMERLGGGVRCSSSSSSSSASVAALLLVLDLLATALRLALL